MHLFPGMTIFSLWARFNTCYRRFVVRCSFYKFRLVPSTLSLIGIAGVIPSVSGYLAIMFGVIDRISPLTGWSALPVAVFEFSLGIYLVVKGYETNSKLFAETESSSPNHTFILAPI
jgi:hypothetical protein